MFQGKSHLFFGGGGGLTVSAGRVGGGRDVSTGGGSLDVSAGKVGGVAMSRRGRGTRSRYASAGDEESRCLGGGGGLFRGGA